MYIYLLVPHYLCVYFQRLIRASLISSTKSMSQIIFIRCHNFIDIKFICNLNLFVTIKI